jgi:superfamily II helicase
MKMCSRCKIEKELSSFSARKRSKDGKQPVCRECVKTTNKEYYRVTPQLNEQRRAWKTKENLLVRAHLYQHVLNNPCVDCGETDPIVLEFDHVRGQKEFNIGSAVRNGKTLAQVIDEISKCDVRCANCHKRVTYQKAGWCSRG